MLHQGFLRRAKANGARLIIDARRLAHARRDGIWIAASAAGNGARPSSSTPPAPGPSRFAALAGLPGIGLQPKRRAAFLFRPPVRRGRSALALRLRRVDESWYFKPDAASCSARRPRRPGRAAGRGPEELDIALGIARIEEMTTRHPPPQPPGPGCSFVADGDLVAGFDPLGQGFFWCAAQGVHPDRAGHG